MLNKTLFLFYDRVFDWKAFAHILMPFFSFDDRTNESVTD